MELDSSLQHKHYQTSRLVLDTWTVLFVKCT